MKKVICDNIMNLEDYLLTASYRHNYSYLMALEIKDLWELHDKLVSQLKDVL